MAAHVEEVRNQPSSPPEEFQPIVPWQKLIWPILVLAWIWSGLWILRDPLMATINLIGLRETGFLEAAVGPEASVFAVSRHALLRLLGVQLLTAAHACLLMTEAVYSRSRDAGFQRQLARAVTTTAAAAVSIILTAREDIFGYDIRWTGTFLLLVTAFTASRHLAANAQLMVQESIAEQRRRKSVKERAVRVWRQLLRQLDLGSVKDGARQWVSSLLDRNSGTSERLHAGLAAVLAALSAAWLLFPQSTGSLFLGSTLLPDTPGPGALTGVSLWLPTFAALQMSQAAKGSTGSHPANLPAKLAAGLLIPLIGQSAVLADAVISGASMGQEAQCFALIGAFISASAWLFAQHLLGQLPSLGRSIKDGFFYLQPGSARRAAAG
ncbi:hypothetical protein WJX74_004737 [Apatococcus lobatus]|uniref:Uncharacterized protein n=1 Tax=Apatococcus lobatus TaxID=904363 RepID=A0AAW1QMC5_9CHLO